ncbi:MYND-type domain-containing protein [Mycena kentingensis (nom. inval.)]|nr:MYND-type domain-containing protein [Mycena kentingensis (nom. inval.)]
MVHPFLRLKRLEELSPELQRLAQKALAPDRDFADVFIAGEHANSGNKSIRSSFLPLLYHILDPAKIPTHDDMAEGSSWSADMEIHVYAHDVLLGIVAEGIPYPPSEKAAILDELWKRTIWPWSSFVSTYFDQLEYSPNLKTRLGTRTIMTTNFLSVSRVFMDSPATHRLVLATPGFLAAITSAWPLIQVDQRSEMSVARAEILVEALWGHLQALPRPLLKRQVAEILDGIGGELNELARVICSHIDVLIQLGTRHVVLHIRDVITFILAADNLQNDEKFTLPGPLGVAACNAGIALRILDSIILISEGYMSGYMQDEFRDGGVSLIDLQAANASMVEVLLNTLARFLMFTLDDQTRLAARVFRALSLFFVLFPREVDPIVHINASLLLPVALIDVHAVEILASELARYQQLIVTRPPSSALPEKWNDLVDAVKDRVALLHELNLHSSRKACNNLQCGRISDAKQFKRCGGCRDAYYCSSACQKVDWTTGRHRDICEAGCTTGIGWRYDVLQRRYMKAILDRDYNHFKPYIQAQRAEALAEHPEWDPRVVSTIFDYSSFRLGIGFWVPDVQRLFPSDGACTDSKYAAQDEWLVRAWDHALFRARTGKGRYQIHLFRPPGRFKIGMSSTSTSHMMIPLRTMVVEAGNGDGDGQEIVEIHQ